MLSIVIPVYNEAPSLQELYAEIHWAFAYRNEPLEIIVVDDGSTDRSWEVVEGLHERDPRVVGIRLRRNSGKSIAYAAGFREARGDVIATLDADLQDDPAELVKLVDALSGGYGAVVGWKWQRRDLAIKIWSSRCFNAALGWMCGVRLHDQNSGIRALTREVAQALPLRGDLYRMIPALAAMAGYRVREIPVQHRVRRYGISKYGRTGLRRTFRGFFDLLTVAFLTRFRHRPFHFFGSIGAMLVAVGLTINAYLTAIWFSGQSIGGRPLLTLGVLLLVLGVQFFSTGFLADLVVSGRDRSDTLPVAEVLRSDRA